MSGNIWEVVGGADKGGILVRLSQDLTSQEEADRLSTGARVEELQLLGNRLQYKLLSGAGPAQGWVSTKTGAKPLLLKMQASLKPGTNSAATAWSQADSRLHGVWVDANTAGTSLLAEAGICLHFYTSAEDALADFGKFYPNDRRLVLVATSSVLDGQTDGWHMLDEYRFRLHRRQLLQVSRNVRVRPVFAMISEDAHEQQCKENGIDIQMQGDTCKFQKRIIELLGGDRINCKSVQGHLVDCACLRRWFQTLQRHAPPGIFDFHEYSCRCVDCAAEVNMQIGVVAGCFRLSLPSTKSKSSLSNCRLAYHGTSVNNAISIAFHRRFFVPGDRLPNGRVLAASFGQAWTEVANAGLDFESMLRGIQPLGASALENPRLDAEVARTGVKAQAGANSQAVYLSPSHNYAKYYCKSGMFAGRDVSLVVEVRVRKGIKQFPLTVPFGQLDGFHPLTVEWVVSDAASVVPTALLFFLN